MLRTALKPKWLALLALALLIGIAFVQLGRWQLGVAHDKARAEAIVEYEEEMRERAAPAVLLSRQACLDAHDYHGLNENSAVLKRRAITTK